MSPTQITIKRLQEIVGEVKADRDVLKKRLEFLESENGMHFFIVVSFEYLHTSLMKFYLYQLH